MINISENISLAPLHTLGLPVTARRVVTYDAAADLPAVLAMLAPGESCLVMGQGSNMLFTGRYDGTIIIPHTSGVEIDAEAGEIRAEAGVILDDLIAEVAARGLWWMENLSGIPGTAGASVVQNVGAYGVEIADVVKEVRCYDVATGREEILSARDCRFGYRDSAFKHKKGRVVTSVSYRLDPQAGPRLDYGNVRSMIADPATVTPVQVREAIIAIRDSKLPSPAVTGSAGSFFKNPVISVEQFEELAARPGFAGVPHYRQSDGVKIPAAWLIDHAGCKNFHVGGAALWPQQPLVIVNARGGASPADILSLENMIVDAVERFSGITLHPEVEHI